MFTVKFLVLFEEETNCDVSIPVNISGAQVHLSLFQVQNDEHNKHLLSKFCHKFIINTLAIMIRKMIINVLKFMSH